MNYPKDLGYTYKKPNKLKKFFMRLVGALVLFALAFLLASIVKADEIQPNGRPDLNSATRGSVWLLPSNGIYIEAIQLQSQVNIDVSGMIARAKIKQKFKNSSSLWAEGTYVFPLPENAAVDHMRLIINGRVIEGQIQEKMQARRAYEKARSRGQRAGLVEQQRPNIFSTKLANIAPGADMTIEIEYQQTLSYRDGQYQLRYPLVVGPRYITPSKEGIQNPKYDLAVHASTSDNAADLNQTSISINIDSGISLANIDSPTHAVTINQQSRSRYRVSLRESSVPADRDFVLKWQPELGQLPRATVFNQKLDGYDYSLFTIYPPKTELYNRKNIPRDVVFILDVSGSMSGTSIRQAKEALKLALTRLNASDKFNIIWFNNNANKAYYTSQPASQHRVQSAIRFVDSLAAGGGTEMLPALKLALNEKSEKEYLRQVVFLTDGNVSNERDLFTYIKSHLGNNRLFTVGIGSAPNSFFMKRSAKAGRGTYTFISNISEIASKTEQLFKKLETPALTDIKLNISEKSVEYFDNPIPDLYVGEPVTVALRGKELSRMVSLNGRIGNTPWQSTVNLDRGYANDGVSTAWARKKIITLSEGYHEAYSQSEKEVYKSQIVGVSILHHLVSQFTSLVAVDVTPVNQGGMLHQEQLKNNLPHGWSKQKPEPLMMAQIRLPQTATASIMHLLFALMFLIIGMILKVRRARL